MLLMGYQHNLIFYLKEKYTVNKKMHIVFQLTYLLLTILTAMHLFQVNVYLQHYFILAILTPLYIFVSISRYS